MTDTMSATYVGSVMRHIPGDLCKLRFKGEHGSLGYRRGCIYMMNVERRRFHERIFGHMPFGVTIILHPYEKGKSRIPYTDKGFEANWDILEEIK